MKYARIIKLFAEKGHLTYEDAMDKFYNSDTYTIISEGVADMHCMSDEYLADELLLEFGMMQKLWNITCLGASAKGSGIHQPPTIRNTFENLYSWLP